MIRFLELGNGIFTQEFNDFTAMIVFLELGSDIFYTPDLMFIPP